MHKISQDIQKRILKQNSHICRRNEELAKKAKITYFPQCNYSYESRIGSLQKEIHKISVPTAIEFLNQFYLRIQTGKIKI